MTNTEIRIKAQQIYRALVSATYNDSFGEDDGTMNILMARMMKAAEWAKANGECDAMKQVCQQMFSQSGQGMRAAADEVFSAIFND